jgi:Putative restriction endonuclease
MTKNNRLQFTIKQYQQLHEIGVLHEGCPTELWDGIVYKSFPFDQTQSVRFVRFKRISESLLGETVTVIDNQILKLNDKSQPRPEIMLLQRHASDSLIEILPHDVALVITQDCYSIDIRDRIELLTQYATAGIPELWLIAENSIEQRAAPINTQYTYSKTVSRGDKIVSIRLPELNFQLAEFLGTTENVC